MNQDFTRFQKLPFVSSPAETDQTTPPLATSHRVPQGPGLRQPSAALELAPVVGQRQRAAALQNANARTAPSRV